MNPTDKEISSIDQNFVEQLKEKAATRKKLEQNQMRKQGTMPRHLYNNICQTSNNYLIPIINDFIDRWSTTLFENLYVKQINFKDNVVQFQFEYNKFYPVGHVESLELNNDTTKISVVCYGESSGDPIRIEIYREAVILLLDLSAEFIELFDKPSSIPKPPKNSTREDWLQYALNCEIAGRRYPHKELQKDLQLTYQSTRRVYAKYKREHKI